VHEAQHVVCGCCCSCAAIHGPFVAMYALTDENVSCAGAAKISTVEEAASMIAAQISTKA
jgi:hypothetical protein